MTKIHDDITDEHVKPSATRRTIVVIGPLPPPFHGAAKVTRATIETLARDGWGVTAIDTSVTEGTGRLVYHCRRLRAHLRACGILLTLRGARGRMLYIAGAGGGGLWYQLVVALLGSILRFRIAFHHHSFAYILRRALAMHLLLRVPLHDGCHIALCKAMERGLKDNYRTNARIEVLSNADILGITPPKNPSTARRHSRSSLTLGHLSNLTVEKGLREVIRTLEVLLDAGLPVSLMLAGPTQTAEAAMLVAEASAKFGSSLTYVGGLQPSAVKGFMTQLDAFLFPSRYRNEADPLVVLEALEAGVPVLAYDIGCLRESIGPMGMVVPVQADFAISVLDAVPKVLLGTRSVEDTISASTPSYQIERGSGIRTPRGLTALLLGKGPYTS
jgi:glycosyltransferase involved in cell wall biosynthesis